MKDRQQNIGAAGQWAFEKIAERLGQEPEEYATGRGREVHFKQTDPANPNDLRWLSFFPDEQTVQYSTLGMEVEITMRGMLPPRQAKNGVIFESAGGRARGLVLRNGHAAFEIQPFPTREPLESPTGIPDAQDGQIRESAQSVVPGGAGSEISASPDASPQPTGRTEKQPKVSWTGYVSADPIFSTSNDGTPRVNMVVSEHPDEDTTIYHKVYSTKREAKRLEDAELAKGNRVKVEGYKQDRERKNRDGTVTPEERVCAVHVSIYSKGEPGSSESDAG